ncbi:MAG: GAF domain-containing protein, partial [Myxococcales bacterium]
MTRLRAELARERRITAVLREVSVAIGAADGPADFDHILELILARITDVVDAERATLYLLDEARDELTSRFVSGVDVQTIRVPVGRGIAGAAARSGKTIRIKDAYRDKRFLRDWDEHTGFRTRAILAVPMRDHSGRVVGVVQALNKRGDGAFSKADEELLQALATHAAITIDNYALYLAEIQKNAELSDIKDQLERKVQELDLLVQLEGAMARAGSLEELVRAALSQAIRAAKASAGALLLPDDPAAMADSSPRAGGTPATPATLYFYEPGERRKVRTMLVRPDEGFVGAVFSSGRATVAHQPARNGARKLDEALGFSTSSAMAAALEGPEHRLGSIALYHSAASARLFVDDDLSLLRLIAANVSTSLLLNRSRAQQERAERLSSIGRLLSGVMHDLRSPIAVISGYVQMMSLADDARTRADYAAHIKRQFALIEGMQREVLEFALHPLDEGELALDVGRVVGPG